LFFFRKFQRFKRFSCLAKGVHAPMKPTPFTAAPLPAEANPSLFFSDMGGVAYDQQIVRAIPPYQDMIGSLISTLYLPADKPVHVLELGCGTGNLTLALAHRFTQMHITVVDLSQPMLTTCQQKLSQHVASFSALNQDFTQVECAPNSLDMVVSSLALHHLTAPQKQALYTAIIGWLKPGGMFRCADLCQGTPDDGVMTAYWQRWQRWARNHGASEQEIESWLEHCRTLFWAVYGGQKPVD
jgi:tRNA (cmo5U34)-methyltransferase